METLRIEVIKKVLMLDTITSLENVRDNVIEQIKSMDKDLLLIILGATICCAYYCFKDYKRNKEIKKQERLNQIK